jgi:ferredoxin
MTRWRIEIDTDTCVGSGTCVSLVPDLFTLDDEDRSTPRRPVDEASERLRRVAAYCPTGAIRMTDDATGEPVAGT